MNRRTKTWLLVIVGSFALVGLVFLGVKTLAEREMKEALRYELERSLTLSFDSLQLDLFSGDCYIEGVKMEPPVTQFLGKKATVSAKMMQVKNVGWLKLLWFNEFNADLMEVENPVVVLEETSATMLNPPKKEANKGKLGVIQIDKVVFRNAHFRILGIPADTLHTHADTLSFDLRGLRIRMNEHQSLRLRSADFSLADFKTNGSDSLAIPAFSAENFKIHFDALRMTLDGDLPVNVQDLHFSFKNLAAKSVREVSPRTWTAGNFGMNLRQLRLTLKNNRLLDVGSGDVALQKFLLQGDPKLGEATIAADDFKLDWKKFYLGIEKLAPVSLGDLSLALENVKVAQPGGDLFHDLHIQSVAASKQKSTLELTGFALRPKYDKQIFSKKIPNKLSRKHFEFPEISMRGVHFDRLLKGDFIASHVTINRPRFDLFDDQNVPPGKLEYKALPHEQLRKASLTLHFDTVAVRDGSVHYEAIELGKMKPGVVEFAPLQVTALNLTNDSASLRRNSMLTISAKAKFQKQAWVTNRFEMDLRSPTYAFTCEGSAEPMPFSLFNGFLSPSANLHFEGGNVTKLNFDFRADSRSANGKMNLHYHGLDIAVQDETKQKKIFLSELAELVMLIKNNQPGDDDFRMGKISVEREQGRGFFNYWWRALQSGLTSTVLSNAGKKQMQKQQLKKQAAQN